MVFNQDNAISSSDEMFDIRLVEWCETQVSLEDYGIYECDDEVLKSLNENEVNKLYIIIIH